ncbi:MAG: GNAT family N-acetyltransferase [Lachnospiraceae bacterium]|nr:GNAT family N-acetyltransferase [Lachnospiraceae bacterium]
MEIIKDYRDDTGLRRSFNELADKTFGLDFENWYQNGFWGDAYSPYSVVENGRVVANVSVNRTDFLFDGAARHFLQLGTVMTDPAYRHRGYIRALMERIAADYEDRTEGIYLFANDSVLDFYPRFGFRKSREYLHSLSLQGSGAWAFQPLAMDCPAARERLGESAERSIFRGRLDLIGNRGLLFFYITGFLQNNVYYHAPSDTYIVAERQGDRLLLHNVFSSRLTELAEVLELLGGDVRQVTLGFTPAGSAPCQVTELWEEDCTLFVKGDPLGFLEQEKLRIPSLAHA